MATRRAFLAGLIAAGAAPLPCWADAGSPDFLAAGATRGGDYLLCGLRADGSLAFRLPLPGRGHAAAGHPVRPEAVAFARRPGTFAVVIDCRSGELIAELQSPALRHFYGHGVFSADGSRLYTTENAYDTGAGMIGIWDADAGYVRIGEFASNGIGPHDVLRLPGTGTLVVANGGIDTRPDSGRAKLNIPTMAPNLSYLDTSGQVLDEVALPWDHHLNSIRHLALRPDGLVAAAMQWEGDIAAAPPLLMLHRMGEAYRLAAFDDATHARMRGYAGSVAFSGDGSLVAMTSPDGSVVQSFEAETGRPVACLDLFDASGAAPGPSAVLLTSGSGTIGRLAAGRRFERLADLPLAFDNHLVALAPVPA